MSAPTEVPRDDAVADVVPGWAVWSLRLLTLIVAILVLVQAVLAGLFVTGDVEMLEMHSINATILTSMMGFQIIAAILVWRPGHGPAWPIWVSSAIFFVAEVQLGFGYARTIEWHIPLGVALFGATVLLVPATWSAKMRVRRSRRKRAGVDA